MKRRIINEFVAAFTVKSLLEENKLKGKIREITSERTRIIVDTGDAFIINLCKGHYFLEFDTKLTKSWVYEAIKNPDTKIKPYYRKVGNKWREAKDRTIMSSELITMLLDEKGFFKPMTWGDAELVKCNYLDIADFHLPIMMPKLTFYT